MAGELPSFNFGAEPEKKSGKKDSRKSTIPATSLFASVINPEGRRVADPAVAAKANAIGRLFVEKEPDTSLPEGKPKKKKKTRGAILPVSPTGDTEKPTPALAVAQSENLIPPSSQGEAKEHAALTEDQRLKKEKESNAGSELAQGWHELPLKNVKYIGEMMGIDLHDGSLGPEHPTLQNGEDAGNGSLEKSKDGSEQQSKEELVAPDEEDVASQHATQPFEGPSQQSRLEPQPITYPETVSPGYGASPEAMRTTQPDIPLNVELQQPGAVLRESSMLLNEAERQVPVGEPYAPITELTDDVSETIPSVRRTSGAGTDGAWSSAEAFRRYEQPTLPSVRQVYQPVERAVTQKEVDDAVYAAAETGRTQGLVLGGAVAVYEHFKHRGIEKRIEKRASAQDRQRGKEAREQRVYFAEQTKQQAESNRRLEVAERRSVAAERQAHTDRERADQAAAKMAALQKASERQTGVTPELLKQLTPEQIESVSIPPEHVVQSSAWHNIEVDKRTGRPVESPTFAYGREYYRERAHENRPVDQHSTAAGGVALAGTRINDDNANVSGATSKPPTSYIPSATTQGPPHKRRSAAGAIRGQLGKANSAAPIWPYLVALVVILFCLAVLLH